MNTTSRYFYLAEWGGAARDKAYKYAGSLSVIGPFDTSDDAYFFARIFDEYGSDWKGPSDHAVLEGEIVGAVGTDDRDPLGSSGGIKSPEERLRERYEFECDIADEGTSSEDLVTDGQDWGDGRGAREVLDRWWPTWRQDLDARMES